MPQIKITISDDELAKLKEQANLHLNSVSKEARLIINQYLYKIKRVTID
jgi:hypothetical protein